MATHSLLYLLALAMIALVSLTKLALPLFRSAAQLTATFTVAGHPIQTRKALLNNLAICTTFKLCKTIQVFFLIVPQKMFLELHSRIRIKTYVFCLTYNF